MGKALVVDSANQGSIARGEPTTIVVAGGVPYFVDSSNNITALGLASSFANNITAGSPDITISGLATDGSPDLSADYVRAYDASAGGTKKVLLGSITGGDRKASNDLTTGTTIDFTVPSWVTDIVLMVKAVSTNGTGNFMVQLGDSGGIETTGYSGAASNPPGALSLHFSEGAFVYLGPTAAATFSGVIRIIKQNANDNTWMICGNISRIGTAGTTISSGHKSLSASLTTVRFKTQSNDTFDGGAISATYR